MKLDLKDRKILYELDLNARRTDSEIGKKVGLKREVVSYRINRLINEGIIKNFITILNDYALGYQTYRIFIKFRDLTEKKEQEIVNYIKDKAKWFVKVRGRWSFNFTILTKDIFALEKFLNNLKNEFQNYFIELNFSLITRVYNYRRGYLVNKNIDRSKYELMGEVVEKYNADPVDIKILKILQNNARMSSVEISNKLNVSERIIRYRIKRLIKNKVIIGFRSMLDLNKLGYSYYKIHLKYKIFNQKTIEKIKDYLHFDPNIIYKTETIGGPDLEFEIQAINNKEMYAILDKFIKEFEGVVDDYEILEYEKEYKLSYLNEI
ncbi:hypothetical protein A3K73_06305 [Candidatus Pacearchaeota archaeon RBG_13_36_9]|nr:MAG: hypothetical protein A3K73_06305 [Candidatus Pacearchaeota archaeon RBG_13_36_9]HJX51009.1 Lrp/AsnC family transcriptional regulator [Candidatus Nanoarchaeia archaeon]